MQKLHITFENCYGIKRLEKEFNFSRKNTFAIYAPNGVMKTSFAKSFKDLSTGKDSRDLVFPDRENLRNIKDETDADIKPEAVFVIEPYNEQFNSDKLSTLLIKRELKEEYDDIYKNIELEKNNFIKKLKGISQSSDCESELTATFTENPKESLFDLLSKINEKLDGLHTKFSFRYNDVFDKKGNVKKFLDKNSAVLDSYIENYEKIISKSSFFKKSDNTFGTYQAGEMLKSVSDNSFFEAGHNLQLLDNTKIDSADTFKNLLEEEINKVVNDKNLKKIFDKVDTAIGSNAELRAFKVVIEKDNSLLIELKDYENFRKKVWQGYLDQLKNDLEELLKFYDSKKILLEDIVSRAKKEETDWEKAIETFNKRFSGLPFKLSMDNKEDVLLKTSTPSVEFIFFDNQEERKVERAELLSVLSQGERRALYLLNIIFEVQARKKINQETLLIIDDIADSFDYKNKYAIIEYLSDISEDSNFKQIILTHNFDFFRTVQSRFIPYNHCMMVEKTDDEIKVEKAAYIRNPFKYWMSNLSDGKKLIASIPFVRNIIEYTKGDSDPNFLRLTSLLHLKSDTESIQRSDLQDIYNDIFPNLSLSISDGSEKVIDNIFDLADCCLTATESINLENKILLSIAIRLKAEEFILSKITDKSEIEGNQTRKLFERFKTEYGSTEQEKVELLEQVNLMTPENIHFNSFMYEPILDMSDIQLKSLYEDTKNKL
ncbi:hypothetical protein [Syntrophus aciditrophicus]|uniref:Hypothetical cytosolic protein n=1 Tax=Syntrophus aciditrophicus (strain SB) TaxID=56780 RepID=Q2LV06_SYNAS|nr:hypothetical protein [Syntrophus aciditrophicus]ABC77917.1 hypothetical cytosolic protein [Syntrophus aciditrophicus SB]